jgi:hypothetical protein
MKTEKSSLGWRDLVSGGFIAALLLGTTVAHALTVTFTAGTPSYTLNNGSLGTTPGVVSINLVAQAVSPSPINDTNLSGSSQTGIATSYPLTGIYSTYFAASAVDHVWVQPDVTNGTHSIQYKFDIPVSEVIAVPGIDHDPLPEEALEFIVWGCIGLNDDVGSPNCEEGAIKAIYDDGVDPADPQGIAGRDYSLVGSSDDFASVWIFSKPYSYFIVSSGDHVGFNSVDEFEFDGLATPVTAGPIVFQGHTYEIIRSNDISWAAANAAAMYKSIGSFQGHLATLTSQAENDFIDELRQKVTQPFPAKSELWIGGYQDPPTETTNTAGWTWVNGEGAIPGTNAGPGYANWYPGEPNGGTYENFLTIGRWPLGQWNDSNELTGYIGGYVVEYDGTSGTASGEVPADECTGDGCNPSGVQQVVLPASVNIPAGVTLTQVVQEVLTDPRVDSNGNCTLTADGFGGTANPRQSLDVFGDGSLILPPYLCGSPKFAVVKSDLLDGNTPYLIPSDVVRSEQFPENLLAQFYACDDPLDQRDLQQRGVFGWQPDDPANVLEGHAIDLTNDCGSSRGATPSASWFVLNLHVDCGIPFDSNDTAVKQCFIDLTSADFVALGQSLEFAKKFLTVPQYGKLRSLWSSASDNFLLGNYPKALQRLDAFISQVNAATFNDPTYNHQGNLLARAEHIRFNITEKIVP